MSTPDTTLALLRKIKALADSGRDGERNAAARPVQDRGGIGIGTGFRLVQHLQNAAHLARTACRSDEIQRLVIESDECRGVALFDVKIGERGGEILRVFQF